LLFESTGADGKFPFWSYKLRETNLPFDAFLVPVSGSSLIVPVSTYQPKQHINREYINSKIQKHNGAITRHLRIDCCQNPTAWAQQRRCVIGMSSAFKQRRSSHHEQKGGPN